MNTEKRKTGIRHRVDQIAHQLAAGGNDLVVFAPEGNDAKPIVFPSQSHDPIAVQARAIDHAARFDVTYCGFQNDPGWRLHDASYFAASEDLPAGASNQLGIFLRDERVIGDSGPRHIKRGDARRVRLDIAQLLWPNLREAGHAVCGAAAHEFLKAGELRFAGRDHDLSADFVWDAVFAAELHHRTCAGHAILRLQRAGPIVNAGVNDTAVMSGLMARDRSFFFQNGQTNSRVVAQRLKSRSQTNDSTADDGKIKVEVHVHPRMISEVLTMRGSLTFGVHSSRENRESLRRSLFVLRA